MVDKCSLREANGLPAGACDKEECVFWRAIDHIGQEAGEGCAIQHFELLGQDGIAEWLLSVKDRIEQQALGREGE